VFLRNSRTKAAHIISSEPLHKRRERTISESLHTPLNPLPLKLMLPNSNPIRISSYDGVRVLLRGMIRRFLWSD
jgi:hypothetical protein